MTGGERRQPLHQQELVYAERRPGVHQALGEWLSADEDDGGGEQEHGIGDDAPTRGGAPMLAAGPTSSG